MSHYTFTPLSLELGTK